MVNLQGELASVREWQIQDGKPLWQLLQNQNLWRSSVVSEWTWPDVETAERKVIEWSLASAETSLGVFAVSSRQKSKGLLGLIGLRPQPKPTGVEFDLVYAFDQSTENLPSIAEAAQLWLQFAFAKWGLAEFHARVEWPVTVEHQNFLQALGLVTTGRHENAAKKAGHRSVEVFRVHIQ